MDLWHSLSLKQRNARLSESVRKEMKELDQIENMNDLISDSKCCLLQFGDETCGPCYAIRNRLDRWVEGHPECMARYIPISEFQELSAQMGVFTVPTVRFYMDGKLAADESGYFSLDRMLDRAERDLKMLSDGADSRDAVRDE